MNRVFVSFSVLSLILIIDKLNASSDIAVVKVAKVPEKATYITQPPKENDKLYVVNQKGKIYIIQSNKTLMDPFLDISDRVHGSLTPGSKKGLVGLAFHPRYDKNGYFFVSYINHRDSTIVSRFTVSNDPNLADRDSEKLIIKIAQPFGNHNGGHLTFGPKDGMLYIGLGDGGGDGDPYNNAQNQNTLLGTILRINIDNGDPYSIPEDNPYAKDQSKKKEIFCYGLRNPWRFSFDRLNNDLIIGDIGQNLWEEINWTSWENAKGANFGWNIMEGNHCYDSESFCDTSGITTPVHEYPNNGAYLKILIGMDDKEATGCSVTGGYVYRGRKNSYWGTYIFGDYCAGKIWSFKLNNGKVSSFKNISKKIKKTSSDTPLFISSFGEDSVGELYIVDYFGAVYKVVYR